MRLFIFCFVLLLLFLAQASACGQHLVLYSNGKVRARFAVADELYLSLRNKSHVRGKIVAMRNDSILLTNDTVSVYDIHRIKSRKLPHGFDWTDAGQKLMVFGALLMIGDFVTVSWVQDRPYEANEGVFISSLSAIGAGAAIIVLSKRPVVLNRRHRLRIVTDTTSSYRFNLRNEK